MYNLPHCNETRPGILHDLIAAQPLGALVTLTPADFIDQQLAAMAGIAIPVARLTGTWKVRQNRPAADRARVERGLRQEAASDSAGMADLVRQFGQPPAPS